MTARLIRLFGLGIVTALAASAAIANAAPINYGNYTGGGTLVDFLSVTEDSSTDATPLYGAPTRFGNQLFFLPGSFLSSSANGSSDQTSGQLTMNIRAPIGQFLQKITVSETLQYSFTGAGTPATHVQASGIMKITDFVPGTNGSSSPGLAYNPTGSYAMPANTSGVFTAGATVDLTGLNIREVSFDLTNLLESFSEAGTSALLRKTSVGGMALTVEIPEPATLFLLPIGLLLLSRRRP